MGIVVSRYLDPASSEGALVRFIIDSVHLMRTLLTADVYFPDLTPWNVIDFRADAASMRALFETVVGLDGAEQEQETEVFDEELGECGIGDDAGLEIENETYFGGSAWGREEGNQIDHDLFYMASSRILLAELPMLCV